MIRDLTKVPRESGIKALQGIWGAMIFSVGIYAVIPWMVRSNPRFGSGNVLTAVLGAVSIVLFVVQIKLRQNLDDEKLFPRILDLGSWGFRPETAGQFQEIQVPERGAALILQAHTVFGIVIWAMADALGIFGMVLSLLTGDIRIVGIFGSVSIAQMIWFRPKGEAFREQVKRWYRYVEANRGKWGETGTQDAARSNFIESRT